MSVARVRVSARLLRVSSASCSHIPTGCLHIARGDGGTAPARKIVVAVVSRRHDQPRRDDESDVRLSSPPDRHRTARARSIRTHHHPPAPRGRPRAPRRVCCSARRAARPRSSSRRVDGSNRGAVVVDTHTSRRCTTLVDDCEEWCWPTSRRCMMRRLCEAEARASGRAASRSEREPKRERIQQLRLSRPIICSLCLRARAHSCVLKLLGRARARPLHRPRRPALPPPSSAAARA